MDIINIGILQGDILFGDIPANQEKISSIFNEHAPLPELVILPETYSTGFYLSPDKLNSELLRKQINWQKQLSKEFSCSIMGSIITEHQKLYKNTLLYTSKEGADKSYHKRHLFQNENKSGLFQAGNENVLIEHDSIKIKPLICYDLRFPVWSRNIESYDILVYVANWPASRQKIWNKLLCARAIENQCYVVGVNRVGTDGNNINYVGGSVVYDPYGETIIQLSDKEEYAQVQLNIKHLHEFRSKFPVLNDADTFKIINPE